MSDYLPEATKSNLQEVPGRPQSNLTAGARFWNKLNLADQTFPTLYSSNTLMVSQLSCWRTEQTVTQRYDAIVADRWPLRSDFVSINPNPKIPAMMDYSEDQPVRVLNQLTSCFTWLKILWENSFQLITQNVRKCSTGSFGNRCSCPFLEFFGQFSTAPKNDMPSNRF